MVSAREIALLVAELEPELALVHGHVPVPASAAVPSQRLGLADTSSLVRVYVFPQAVDVLALLSVSIDRELSNLDA